MEYDKDNIGSIFELYLHDENKEEEFKDWVEEQTEEHGQTREEMFTKVEEGWGQDKKFCNQETIDRFLEDADLQGDFLAWWKAESYDKSGIKWDDTTGQFSDRIASDIEGGDEGDVGSMSGLE